MKTKKSLKISYINFFHDYTSLPFPRARLKRTAERIYQHHKEIMHKAVNVIFCSDYFIRKLNRDFRHIDHTTDVLSFPFNDEDFLGEIYISLQRAAIQARRFKCSYADEVNRLLVHGFLHLLGYDHEIEKERIIMEAQEKRYC